MRAFIDTNVLIYWVDVGARADLVERLLMGDCVISVQVLNEFANVLRKKRALAWSDIQLLSTTLMESCQVMDWTVRTHQSALVVAQRYKVSLYDATIVAAAGLAGCAVLYSEDLQDGMKMTVSTLSGKTTLTVCNPFAAGFAVPT